MPWSWSWPWFMVSLRISIIISIRPIVFSTVCIGLLCSSVLNSASYLIFVKKQFDHIIPALIDGFALASIPTVHYIPAITFIQYKILSLTHKSLQYNKPSSISYLLTIVQPTCSTQSSAVVILCVFTFKHVEEAVSGETIECINDMLYM